MGKRLVPFVACASTVFLLPCVAAVTMLAAGPAGASSSKEQRRRKQGEQPDLRAQLLARVIAEYPLRSESTTRRPLANVLADYTELVDDAAPRDLLEESNVQFAVHDLLKCDAFDALTGPKTRTVGSSVDSQTYEVFNSIVALTNQRPGIVLGRVLELFIFRAREHLPFLIDRENGPGAHAKRMESDTKYRQIFEWTPRFSSDEAQAERTRDEDA